MKYLIRRLLLAGWAAATIVRCVAQPGTTPHQTPPALEKEAPGTKIDFHYMQPWTRPSEHSQAVMTQGFLEDAGVKGLMRYDIKIVTAATNTTLRFDYSKSLNGSTSLKLRGVKTGARAGHSGIEEAERMNLLLIKDYHLRSRNAPDSSARKLLHPSTPERMFNVQ